ncbi:hypothetical protein [Galactobacter valiniphilus]|uniref:hypothetical protein n=1 Tax=Galactobacter valiniphilus TaxID=2676122 RepID=UPI0037358AAA
MTTLDTLRQLLTDATRHSPAPWGVYPDLTDEVHDDCLEPVSYGPNPAGAALIAAAPTHLADLITALEREAKMRELHKPSHHFEPYCKDCISPYPCPTIRILDGNE